MGAALCGMLTTLASWLVLLVVLFGVGCLVLRLVGRGIASAESAFTAFWLGWATIIALLQLWHLVLAVGPASFWGVVALASAGLAMQRESVAARLGILRRIARDRPREATLIFAGASIALLWLANRTLGPITPQGDAGLYHIGTVRWIQAHAIVPGLANVDGRFGFNSSSFLYLAMLDVLPGPPRFNHLGTPVLLIAFSAQTWMYVVQLFRERSEVEGHRFLGALWAAGLVPYYFNEFASTSTDTPGLLLGLLLGLHSFRIVFGALGTRELAFETCLVIFYTAIGIATKLSFGFLGAGASAVAVFCLLERLRAESGQGALEALRPHLGKIVVTALVVLAVLVPWLSRGVILTGYVAYPSNTVLHLDVDWKVSEEQVVAENEKIKVWARVPRHTGEPADEILGSWDWFIPWLGRTSLRADLFTYPLALFLGAGVVYLRRARAGVYEAGRALLLLTPSLVASILWFVTAPAERFGGAIFWLLGAGMMAALFQQSPASEFKRKLVSVNLSLIALSLVIAFVASAVFSHQRYGWAVFVPPGTEAGFHPIPEVETAEREALGGLSVRVPRRIAQSESHWKPGPFCWDAPQPCSMRFHADLELREPSRVAAGFRRGPVLEE